MASLLRQLGVIVTYLLLALALIQMLGRIVLWNIGGLETRINFWLEDSGIVLSGLNGRWSLLNPVLFIDELEFDGAKLHGMEIEIDTLESLARNRMVADHIHIENVEATVRRTEQGWRWPGSEQGEGSFDLWTTLRYSDYVSVFFQISLDDHGVVQDYLGTIESSNKAQVNRVRLRIRDKDSCEDCWVSLAYDEETSTKVDGFHSSYTEVNFENWSVPALILPVRSGANSRVSGRAIADFTGEHGQLIVDLTTLFENGDESPPSFRIMSRALNSVSSLVGEVEVIQKSIAGDQRTTLPTIFYEYDWVERTTHIWVDEIAVEVLFDFLAVALGSDTELGSWTANLGARGRFEKPQLLIEPDDFTFSSIGKDLSIEAYRGVPSVKLEEVAVSVTSSSLLLDFPPQAGHVAVVDYFDHAWEWNKVGGRVLIVFGNEQLGIWGYDLSAADGIVDASVDFGLTRNTSDQQYQFRIEGNAERIDVAEIPKVIPNVLDEATMDWMEENILEGSAQNVFFSFHTYRSTEEDPFTSRFELTGLFQDTFVNYYEGWPIIERADGAIEVVQDELRLALTRGFVMNVPLLDADVLLAGAGDESFVHTSIRVDTEFSNMFDFNWISELHEYLPFVEKTWYGTGSASVDVEVTLPLSETAKTEAHVKGTLALDDGALELPEYNISLSQITGSVAFETPTFVRGDSLEAVLFDNAVNIDIASSVPQQSSSIPKEPAIYIDVDGLVAAEDVFVLLDMDPMPGFNGATPFTSRLTVYPDSDRPSALDVESDLEGIEIDLPRPLQKLESELRSTQVQMVFHSEWTAATMESDPFRAALQVDDSEVIKGVVALSDYPSATISDEPGITVMGTLEEFDFGEASTSEFQIDEVIRFEDFTIARLNLGTQQIPNVAVAGTVAPELIELTVDSEPISASINWRPDQPYEIHAAHLVVHRTDSDEDPLSLELAAELPRINVVVDQLHYVDEHGDHDWGTWKFELHPASSGIEIREFSANFGGFQLVNDPTTVSIWDIERNRTRFKGELQGGDLGEALTMWDYYDAVESESFEFQADLSWNGSPLMFEFKTSEGGIVGDVQDGRLIDVTQAEGAIKLTGLLNFTTLLERFQLDFGDIVDKGLSFDRILLESELNQGKFLMRSPLAIKGPGSEFLIGGAIDANTETIDCEVIVTLPLSRSLPWYAATLASSNPVSAIGVLIGQRIFAAQLDRMSSGKYRLSGTFDKPEVEFVGMFLDEISALEEQPNDNEVELNSPNVTEESEFSSGDEPVNVE